jgi:aspartate kinase
MTLRPVVIKLGGDALASPERIASEALRVARLAAVGPVVAVVSARRGRTDQLFELVTEVGSAARRLGGSSGGTESSREPTASLLAAEADRAVASGEVVAAALLALALNQLGVGAVSLDAREAGVKATGRAGHAVISRIDPRRIRRLLKQGVAPVVTGFQGWRRGRVATLARGGTDSSAVALADALKADRVILVKDTDGLRTADPRLVPDSRPIPRASHRFLTALTAAGAGVVQLEAARLAERLGVSLEFRSLALDAPLSVVTATAGPGRLRAVTSAGSDAGWTAITVVAEDPADLTKLVEPCLEVLTVAGIGLLDRRQETEALQLLVPAADAAAALRLVHGVVLNGSDRCTGEVRRAS